ncbi:cupin domain-containing protein [Streptomyces sp. WZ-12]|uniref:cupin domain-containing protein n=1 Tax=Streptomyces sp. WZ-12 TaxID=3030210 RepID=UPI0023817F5F|nr:cupin domain-containing protein [Streptomyces sp. WZ-12]
MTEPQPTFRVIRANETSLDTQQSPGAQRMAAVSATTTDAKRIWFGRVTNEPGMRSVPHHHGEAETAGYVVNGRMRIYHGEGFKEYVDLDEGDFVYLPPYFPHIEANLSDTAELVLLAARTPDNIVENLDDPDQLDHWHPTQ